MVKKYHLIQVIFYKCSNMKTIIIISIVCFITYVVGKFINWGMDDHY